MRQCTGQDTFGYAAAVLLDYAILKFHSMQCKTQCLICIVTGHTWCNDLGAASEYQNTFKMEVTLQQRAWEHGVGLCMVQHPAQNRCHTQPASATDPIYQICLHLSIAVACLFVQIWFALLHALCIDGCPLLHVLASVTRAWFLVLVRGSHERL